MGLVSGLLDETGLSVNARKRVLEAIGNKNVHEIQNICRDADICSKKLEALARISGKADLVIPELNAIFENSPEFLQLKQLLSALDKCGVDCINVDFSVVNDMNYYNGIVFRGFIEGVPEGVLSGGQYDSLMSKMKHRGKAVGFALYPDLLERLFGQQPVDVDVALYYDESSDIAMVASTIEGLASEGIRVIAQPGKPANNSGKFYRVVDNEVQLVEA
jgi:ATP phosphoribosyltransferase regulatory subunit